MGAYSGLGQASGSERYFLYRVLRALDLAALLSRAMRAEREAAPDGPGQELALRLRRDELARRIDDFRRMLAQELRLQQLQLHDPAPAPPRRLDELDLLDASTLDRRAMRQAVRPLARKLAARVAQRRRLHRGGRLDVRRTIRRSLSAGGTPIDPAFRRAQDVQARRGRAVRPLRLGRRVRRRSPSPSSTPCTPSWPACARSCSSTASPR